MRGGEGERKKERGRRGRKATHKTPCVKWEELGGKRMVESVLKIWGLRKVES